MAVAGATGFRTYDLTVGVKLDFEDAIYLLTPFDVPLQGSVDSGGRTMLATRPTNEKKVEWQDEQLLVQRSLVAGGGITNVATTLVVTTGDGTKFGPGDLLIIEAEYVRVTSVSGDSLTVTRSYAGSTAAAHAAGVDVLGVGQALPEGSDPAAARAVDRVNQFNLTQIFGPWKVHTTETEDAVDKYGLSGTEFDHQVGNRYKEMAVTFEQALLYGERFDDTTNGWRSMGGFKYFMVGAGVVNSTTTTLTEAALLDALQGAYDRGGNPDRIIMGSKNKRILSSFNATLIRYNQDETDRGQVVENYDSDFGRQAVVLDRWCRTADVFGYERGQAIIRSLRPWQFQMLAKTGDATQGMVVGEKTLQFVRPTHSFRFNALT